MAKIDLVTKLTQPNYIKPIKIHYTQKEVQKTWEAVISHDSVAILLWHSEKEAFIAVKQLRVTVLNTHKIDGYTYELCAGIVDKEASKIQIAKEEILEECGYDVPLESISKITSFYTSVGISGAKQTLYFAKCDSSMQVSQGGGIHDEDIEVVYIPLDEAKTFMFDESYHKTPGMMMAFYWFFDNHKRDSGSSPE
ncbi:MAG: NUDIX hydrolase [Sulfurimonas sp.]